MTHVNKIVSYKNKVNYSSLPTLHHGIGANSLIQSNSKMKFDIIIISNNEIKMYRQVSEYTFLNVLIINNILDQNEIHLTEITKKGEEKWRH